MRSSLSLRALARGLTAAMLALALAVGASTPALAELESPDAAATAPGVIIAPHDPVVGEGDAEVQFDVLVSNEGADPLPASTITLELETTRIQSAEGLAGSGEPASMRLAETTLGQVAAQSEQRTTIRVPRDRFLLPATGADGVYLVRAILQLHSADGSSDDTDTADASAPSARTPLVWRGAGEGTVPLSVIVPIVLPEDVRTLPSKRQLEEAVPRLDKLLTAATPRRALLAIDPRIIAGIRAYGTDAPDAAKRFLVRLETTSLPTFLLQFGDADPAAQAALGMTELLQPESLDFASRLGKFPEPVAGEESGETVSDAAEAKAGSDPVATDADSDTVADAENSALPTVDELVTWRSDAIPVGWPAAGTADRNTLSLLRNSGYGTTILDSANVSHSGGPRATLDGATVYISDAAVGAAARTQLGGSNETARDAGAAELAARLTLAAQARAPGIVLALDRGAIADAEDPAQLLQGLGDMAWATPTDITQQPGGSATLEEAGISESRQELLRSALKREPAVDDIGAVLRDPQYLVGYQRARLLNLFATRYASPEVDFESVAADYRLRDAELLSGVTIVSTAHTQLVGTSTQVPVQLRNSLPFDAVVTVRADPSSAALMLTDRSFPKIEVASESTERVLVPVQSRVSSGESGLVLSVSAPSGEPTVFTGTLPISIRSSVETITLWTFGVLAALLLGFGTWRSIERRRRTWEAAEEAAE